MFAFPPELFTAGVVAALGGLIAGLGKLYLEHRRLLLAAEELEGRTREALHASLRAEAETIRRALSEDLETVRQEATRLRVGFDQCHRDLIKALLDQVTLRVEVARLTARVGQAERATATLEQTVEKHHANGNGGE